MHDLIGLDLIVLDLIWHDLIAIWIGPIVFEQISICGPFKQTILFLVDLQELDTSVDVLADSETPFRFFRLEVAPEGRLDRLFRPDLSSTRALGDGKLLDPFGLNQPCRGNTGVRFKRLKGEGRQPLGYRPDWIG